MGGIQLKMGKFNQQKKRKQLDKDQTEAMNWHYFWTLWLFIQKI